MQRWHVKVTRLDRGPIILLGGSQVDVLCDKSFKDPLLSGGSTDQMFAICRVEDR